MIVSGAPPTILRSTTTTVTVHCACHEDDGDDDDEEDGDEDGDDDNDVKDLALPSPSEWMARPLRGV